VDLPDNEILFIIKFPAYVILKSHEFKIQGINYIPYFFKNTILFHVVPIRAGVCRSYGEIVHIQCLDNTF
jgi:hypothetical protein